jgi:predicted SAM-dependent methyltransferase
MRHSATPDVASTPLRLNLGSGPHAEPGWINVDKSWSLRASRHQWLVEALFRVGIFDEHQRNTRWPEQVRQHDLTRGLPWMDGSAEAIYSSHMLEHFDRHEAVGLLNECRRVLQPGGVLRLALPDLNAAARRYLRASENGEPDAADALLGFLYLVPNYREMSLIRRTILRALHHPHMWMYDEASLCRMLTDAGFTGAAPVAFREGACPDLATLETRSDDVFERSTFFVEAMRP